MYLRFEVKCIIISIIGANSNCVSNVNKRVWTYRVPEQKLFCTAAGVNSGRLVSGNAVVVLSLVAAASS